MKKHQFNHVLKSIDKSTDKEYNFILIGSQAILAHFDSDYFDSDNLFISREIDVIPNVEDYDDQQKIIDFIDANFGQQSMFDNTFKYYADGVDFTTATLADGWKDRLVGVDIPNTKKGRFQALSFEDLIVSKIMANRDKDLKFIEELCKTSWPPLKNVSSLLDSLDNSAKKDVAINKWNALKEKWKIDDLPISRMIKFK